MLSDVLLSDFILTRVVAQKSHPRKFKKARCISTGYFYFGEKSAGSGQVFFHSRMP